MDKNSTIEECIQDFPQTIAKNAYRLTEKEKILEAVAKAEEVRIPDIGGRWEFMRKRKSQTMLALARKYMIAALSEHFAILHQRIIDMPRYLQVVMQHGSRMSNWKVSGTILADQRTPFAEDCPKYLNEGNIKRKIHFLEGKLFAYAQVDLDGEIEAEVATGSSFWSGSRNYRVVVSARLPGVIDDNLLRAFALGRQHYHQAMAEVYKVPKLADMFTWDDSDWNRETPEIGVLWIPTRDALQVGTRVIPRPGDPVMVLKIFNTHFILKIWNVENEEPFEHLIREFSVGELIPND